MKPAFFAVGWGIAMLAITWAGDVGALSADMTRTLVVILPVLAVMSATRGLNCPPRGREVRS